MEHYLKSSEQLFKEFETGWHGLSIDDVNDRLKIYGLNEIIGKGAIPWWLILLHQFSDPLVIILLVASVVALIIGEEIDSAVIFAVVVINAIIGFTQEFKADKAMLALRRLASPKATVVRGGKEIKIDARNIVPGDIILLQDGNKVPADCRILEAWQLEIDESMLTGESVPVQKHGNTLTKERLAVSDQINMSFMGTMVTHGRGRALCIATGMKTELGKISHEVERTQKESTPLERRLRIFTKNIGIAAISLASLVFFIGILKGLPVINMILFGISTAVAVIPEGLPIVITVTMAVGLVRMSKRNALIRRLMSVETLGSCNIICSDKTGTITQNVMTVIKAYAGGKEFTFEGIGYIPNGKILLNDKNISTDQDLQKLLTTGLLCNSASLYEENSEWKINGDPTEAALVVSAQKFGINEEIRGTEYKLIDEIPFSSQRKYMVSLYSKGTKCIMFVKGAPERILELTKTNKTTELAEVSTEYAKQGLRVLGFCMKEIDSQCGENIDLEKEVQNGMQFTGFQCIIDPPRQSAIKAIEDAHAAGIDIIMITGDHKITAAAIAKQTGILNGKTTVVSGEEIEAHDLNYLKQTAKAARVYARVSPHHKLQIVTELQEQGNTVAVTGDGVNDAPALKRANIGIAMGLSGTDVAREAADMVLKDDNFASILEAIKIGRVIFDNIRKVSMFLLCSAVGIPLLILTTLIFGFPLPFLATQVLWINLATNGLQDLALAYEPGEKDVHLRRPRNPKENIISKRVLLRVVFVGVIIAIGGLFMFLYELSRMQDVSYARSAALNTVVFFQFFNAWNSRSLNISVLKVPFFSNPFLLISLALSIVAQISVFHAPFMQYIFKTEALELSTWIRTIGVGAFALVVVEVEKFIREKSNKKLTT